VVVIVRTVVSDVLAAFVDGSTLRLLFDLYRCLPPTLSPLVCHFTVCSWQCLPWSLI